MSEIRLRRETSVRENRVLSAWRAGARTFGPWLMLDNCYTADAISALGYDFVCVDLQHGLLDYEGLLRILPGISASPTVPFVRVAWNEPQAIMKALDAGAYGVIVPMVNNRAEAEKAVAACRYAPDGARSYGPLRASLHSGEGYLDEANQQIACVVMVETREAVENISEIAGTPGLDGVFIGSADLAISLGLPLSAVNVDPTYQAQIRCVLEGCRAHNVPVGIPAQTSQQAREYFASGFSFVISGSDAGFMLKTARKELVALREALSGSI